MDGRRTRGITITLKRVLRFVYKRGALLGRKGAIIFGGNFARLWWLAGLAVKGGHFSCPMGFGIFLNRDSV